MSRDGLEARKILVRKDYVMSTPELKKEVVIPNLGTSTPRLWAYLVCAVVGVTFLAGSIILFSWLQVADVRSWSSADDINFLSNKNTALRQENTRLQSQLDEIMSSYSSPDLVCYKDAFVYDEEVVVDHNRCLLYSSYNVYSLSPLFYSTHGGRFGLYLERYGLVYNRMLGRWESCPASTLINPGSDLSLDYFGGRSLWQEMHGRYWAR